MNDLPTGPGIIFKRKKCNSDIFIGKSLMKKSDGWSRMSYASEEWLQYEAKKSEFIMSTEMNTYYPMQRYLSGGEKLFINDGKIFALDGYIKTASQTFAFSFKGCYYHYCPHCKTNIDKKKDEEERDRLVFCYEIIIYEFSIIRSRFTEHRIMFECKWTKFKSMNHIVNNSYLKWNEVSLSESQLVQKIISKEIYGFIKCSLALPNDDTKKRWKDLNFPVS